MIRAFLAHSSHTPEHLGAVLRAAPEFAMGHAVKGLFSLMLGRRELVATAADALMEAKRISQRPRGGGDQGPDVVAGSAAGREQAWAQALALWLRGHPRQAVTVLETVLTALPQDTLTAKTVHGIRFILGDAAGMRASVERLRAGRGRRDRRARLCAGRCVGAACSGACA